MLAIETAAVFVLVAAATAWLGMRADRGARAVDRLRAAPAGGKRIAFAWRAALARLVAAIPAPRADLGLVKRRLVRAGFRRTEAARIFQTVRVTAAVVCGAAAFLFATGARAAMPRVLLAAAAATACGYMAPAQLLLLRIRARQHAIEKALPNTLDLMVVCVESGLGLDQTTLQVAKELQNAHPEICDEFAIMNLELRAGTRRGEALHNMADRVGVDDLKKLVAVLIQTDRFGTSIAQALRGHADYLRTLARQRAEERAAKLAIKLVFPIFFCVLPSLFVVTVGPVLTRLMRDLIPLIENM